MAGGKAGIVYSAVNNIIRRIIVPSNDEKIDWTGHVGKGESILIVDQSELIDTNSPQSLLKEKLGLIAGSPSCAVIDSKGNIVAACLADPLVDAPPEGCRLVLMPPEELKTALTSLFLSAEKEQGVMVSPQIE